MENFVDVNTDANLLLIILDKTITQNSHRSLWFTEFQKLKVRIELETLGTNIISIPPRLGVLHLMAEDLDASIDTIKNTIEAFLKQFPEHVLLVEGLTRFGQKKLQIIQELMLYLFLNYNLGMIPTRNLDETIACIIGLARREQLHDKPPQLHRVKPKARGIHDSQETLIEGFIQCGPTKAEILMHEFQSPMDIFESIINNSSKWKQIGGIGPQFLAQNQILLGKILSKKTSHTSDI